MAATDWFNKPVENSRELILKEAFKLFLQKNVEKVKVSDLAHVFTLFCHGRIVCRFCFLHTKYEIKS
ncbi:MAG: hypothetical protein MR982_11970 [Bacteroides pyogenes]|uniref:hypothetical protein n=1 Tax=Bacteroides pyogenes TaxID=310300 RepID=UPI001D394300|nr:hypothetical protein [Bacteroides pyogenes]MBR8708707.1 hypothetical protein [Bacteroides pyogenes]MBR8717255.1 hypothetical protein [Bacteroides pyogenes]MBR8746967.1 hypothetical protein [Bacteroides pyogenes]MBR8757350.1 hypothetical protein [Bacteroides pyogenes]MBR8780528.1 hypothetical protein [Bacteroides pyogenes]